MLPYTSNLKNKRIINIFSHYWKSNYLNGNNSFTDPTKQTQNQNVFYQQISVSTDEFVIKLFLDYGIIHTIKKKERKNSIQNVFGDVTYDHVEIAKECKKSKKHGLKHCPCLFLML